jgi:hypothetical protein
MTATQTEPVPLAVREVHDQLVRLTDVVDAALLDLHLVAARWTESAGLADDEAEAELYMAAAWDVEVVAGNLRSAHVPLLHVGDRRRRTHIPPD